MKIQASILPLLILLGAAAMTAADADLDASIARHRMGTLVIKTTPGAKVSVEQLRHEFWFGSTLPTHVFNGQLPAEQAARFKELFVQLFNAAVIENSFKWHAMEPQRGQVNYAVVDEMLAWADKENIPVRGHCLFWGVPNWVPAWVKPLGDDELRMVLQQRARSVTARYRGRFAEYDLNNEMIHGNFFEQRLGPEITKQMALWAKEGDPNARLFVNDYEILTGKRLQDYVAHIRRLLDMNVPIDGIGVQGHSHGETFDPAAVQAALDELAKFNLPIRVTELNMPGQNSRFYRDRTARLTAEEERAKADNLRQYLRICFAHPAVTGILLWGFWEGANWIPASSLYSRDWTPTPAAEAYRDLVLNQWWTRWAGTAGPDGWVVLRAFYGKHRVTAGGRQVVVDLTKSQGVRVVELD